MLTVSTAAGFACLLCFEIILIPITPSIAKLFTNAFIVVVVPAVDKSSTRASLRVQLTHILV